MASDSEGFESAEEDAVSRKQKKSKPPPKESNAWNDSDSDGEISNLCEGGDAKTTHRESEEFPTSVKAESKSALLSETDSFESSSGAKTSSQDSELPKRVPKQPNARGLKLGALRVSNKSMEDSAIKCKTSEEESQKTQSNVLEEGSVRRPSGSNSRKSTSSSVKDLELVLEKLSNLSISSASAQENAGWSSWGSWGVNSILSTASSLTTHVSQGISTVTSVLETGLGAPDPEELARLAAEEEKAHQQEKGKGDQGGVSSNTSGGSGSMSFDSVLRLVESTAGGIVSGGLNTLENLGKKTMDVLQDGDPGLKKKRAYFFPDAERPVLSQLLREAKEKAEAESASGLDDASVAASAEKKLHFETLFDDYQGLVHLEALEMLSRQCQMRLQSRLLAVSGVQLTELQRTLAQVKELCEFPDEEEESSEECTPAFLSESLKTVTNGFGMPLPYEKVTSIYAEEEQWLSEVSKDTTDVRLIHTHAITALAKLAAAAAELFHKTAELLLVKERRDTTEEATHLVSMTTLLCSCTSALATKFSDAITTIDEAMYVSDSHRSITNIFLEASNSSSYIQDAGNLLVPVLQVGVCK